MKGRKGFASETEYASSTTMEQEYASTVRWRPRLSARLFHVAVLAIALAAVFGPLLSACAQLPQSVGHLRRDGWSLEEPRSLAMNFMRFDYQIQPVGDVAGVKGWAYLDTASVPEWAKWVDSLSLTAYLCEADGRVVAQDMRTFLPRAVRQDEGVAFEFTLRPEQWGTKPLFITFGYRVVLTQARDDQGGREPFFASEDAITR